MTRVLTQEQRDARNEAQRKRRAAAKALKTEPTTVEPTAAVTTTEPTASVPPSDLDIPDFLKLTPEERAAAWEANPPRPMQSMAAPPREVEQKQAATRKARSIARIGKMKARTADREALQAGKIWDTKTGRWVDPNQPRVDILKQPVYSTGDASATTTTEEEMARKKRVVKDGTKKAQAAALIQRKSGATIEDIRKALKITVAAAAALIGDVRRMGLKLERTRNSEGESVYKVA